MEAPKDDIFARFWRWRLKESPEFATAVGIHDFDWELDDLGPESFARREREAEKFLEEIQVKQESCANKSEMFNYQLLSADIKQFLRGLKFKSFLFPLNQLEGPQSDFPRLISWMKTDTVEDYEKILSRLKSFPSQISQMISLLKIGTEQNYTMSVESIQSVPKQLESTANTPISESKLFKPFLNIPASIDKK